MKDLYSVLGVERSASAEQIRKAFQELARTCHPDTHPDDEAATTRYKEINGAKEILLDPGKRALYDGQTREISGLSDLLARPPGAAAVQRAIPTAPKALRNGGDRMVVGRLPTDGETTVELPSGQQIDVPPGFRVPACGIAPHQGSPGENGGNPGTLFVLLV